MGMTVFPCLVFTWTPLLEEDFGQERFTTDDPSVLFRQGNFSRVNAIMGVTAHEFISPAAGEILFLNQKTKDITSLNFKLCSGPVQSTGYSLSERKLGQHCANLFLFRWE